MPLSSPFPCSKKSKTKSFTVTRKALVHRRMLEPLPCKRTIKRGSSFLQRRNLQSPLDSIIIVEIIILYRDYSRRDLSLGLWKRTSPPAVYSRMLFCFRCPSCFRISCKHSMEWLTCSLSVSSRASPARPPFPSARR